ncbi:hypothetical protein N9L68_07335, partial [bacterium]|nr:hypothetical protein [bacterium]
KAEFIETEGQQQHRGSAWAATPSTPAVATAPTRGSASASTPATPAAATAPTRGSASALIPARPAAATYPTPGSASPSVTLQDDDFLHFWRVAPPPGIVDSREASFQCSTSMFAPPLYESQSLSCSI